MEMDTLSRVKLYGLLDAINEPILNVNWEKSNNLITRTATYKIEITTSEEGVSENMQMETPMNELIKNRICDYELKLTDFKTARQDLIKELTEYLGITRSDIAVGVDAIEITVDSLDKEQLDKICELFDKVIIDSLYGDQVRIFVELE